MNKVCSKCGTEKPIEDFYKLLANSTRLMAECKDCIKQRVRDRRNTEEGKAKRKAYNIAYQQSGKFAAARKKYQQTLKYKNGYTEYNKTESSKQSALKYRLSEKGQELERKKYLRRCQKQGEKLNRAVRAGVNSSLKGTKNGKKWQELVGYSLQDLVTHLEKQFAEGMTWENYGEWHVDHKIPLAAFSFVTPEDPNFRICWGLANLQPMWATDNMRKHTKILEPFQPLLIVAIDKP